MANKKDGRIIFICWLAYTAAYVGRLNYSASLVAIVSDLGITKPQAGLVSSCFFFAYGAGQLLNGILSKYYNPKKMIFASLFASSALNILMPISSDISVMKYIWLANGIVQSVLWSTLIKTISDFVSDKNVSKAIFVMSTTVAAGTFTAYGISALCVKFASWHITFYIASAVLLISSFIWMILYGESSKASAAETVKGEKVKISRGMITAIVIMAFCGIANGFIKDGINTWVPSVLYEEFNISQSFSILLTLLLPLLSMFGTGLANKIHTKIESHSRMNQMFYFAAAVLCAGIIASLKFKSLVFVMICFIGVACTMSMINNVITSMFPLDNRKLLGAGFAAGLLNTFCYVGSTVTSYSLGAVSDKFGWNAVFIIMLAVSAFAVIICFFGAGKKKRNI
ncbi:MAG: MFS transporter [Clostridia bacterium]|nr:MFS transporter [Clostridia bacterium]